MSIGFIVPDGWESYCIQVKSNLDNLIHKGVLQGISPTNLSLWYQNFNTSEELYLAAHLLDSMVFRSEPMLKATCRHIISKILSGLVSEFSLGLESIDDLKSNLKHPSSKPIFLFSTVIADDTPGKSGESLLRLFVKESSINKRLAVYCENLDCESSEQSNLPDMLIILDDMVGTGKQFKEFYYDNNLDDFTQKTGVKVVFIPLLAHEQGLSFLEEKCPQVLLKPVEKLSEQHNFFRELDDARGTGIWARDQINSVDDVRDFYKAMLKKNKIGNRYPFGYGSLGLTVYSSLSSPNNSLHVFYTAQNESDWYPLLQR